MAPSHAESALPQGSIGHFAQDWQEAYLELEQNKRKVQSELRDKKEEIGSRAREAQQLREQIRHEQERRKEQVAELARQLENMERENKQLNMRFMKVQMQDSAKMTDVTTVKKEVVAKTMELEKMMREFQQTHQERLFSRVSDVTSAMLSVCQRPDVTMQLLTPPATDECLAPMVGLGSSMPAVEEEPTGMFLDSETQQALKSRLQSLGDVVVYGSDKFEACCASGRAIPPGALRVRPRRCDHVFLVECLMPYWAEGLCPVCRCSFGYDTPQDAGYDESDRYSGVSTSVSQFASGSMVLPRQAQPCSSNSDGGSLRLPPRGRSSSLSRGRRRRSPGGDAKSDVPGERRLSPSAVGTPPRSAASLQSRASSAPRAPEAIQWASVASSQGGARPL